MTQLITEVLRNWLPSAGKMFYYPNPGNAGDALIATATWQVFDGLRFRPIVSDLKSIPPNATVILGGGGNLVPYYKRIAQALETCIERKVERCLLLPHTIRGHDELLSRLDERFTLICRDETSLEHVRKCAPKVTSLLAADMAWGLNMAELEKRTRTLHHTLQLMVDPSWLKHGIRWRNALSRCKPDANGTLTILRCDREATATELRNPDLDLMEFYKTRNLHRAGCEQVAMDIIKLLRGSGRVITDRLHISLPAMLLGIEVSVIDNNYGKLSAVLSVCNQGIQ